MKKLKILPLLLCLFIVFQTAGCKKAGEDPEITTDSGKTPDETTAAETLRGPKLPDEKFDGETFTIYTRSYSKDSFIVESTGDILDDAVHKRIVDTEEALGVKIESHNNPDDDYGTEAKNTILSGDDAYQLLCGHARMMFNYPQSDLVLDWYELPYIDFSNKWWDDNMIESLSIGGKIYVVADDLTSNALGNTKALLFNKDLFTKYSQEFPYKKVLDMNWTFDEFEKLCKVFAKDLNGDSEMKLEDDQFGFGTSIWGAPINILWSAGQRIYDTTGKDGRIELVLNTQRTVEVFDRFFTLLGSECSCVGTVTASFKEGRFAFMSGSLNGLTATRDMNDDIGIIPFPMLDADQGRYYTGVDASCNGLAVPITVENTGMASAVIEYMSYLCYRDIMPVFYDVVLKTKSSRDDESAAMIDIIRESRLYDIGYFYNGLPMNSVGAELALMSDPNFSSYYAQNESAAKAALAEINEYYFGK